MNGNSLGLDANRQRLFRAQGRPVAFPTNGNVFSVGSDEGKWDNGQLWVRGKAQVDGEAIPQDEWTPVPAGVPLQATGEKSPYVLGIGARNECQPADGPPMLLTFFGDGSPPDIGEYVRNQPQHLEQTLAPQQGNATVRGVVARGGAIKSVALTALPVAMGGAAVAGTVVAAAALIAAGPLAIPLAIWGAALTGLGGYTSWGLRDYFKGGLTGLKERFQHPDVSGWKHVERSVISQSPRQKQFDELWKQNLAKFPTARHVVYLSGHGDAKGAAGLKYKHIAETVKGAEAILLDACNGGQLETLDGLSGSARVAIASEHTVNGYGFPLEQMFAHAQFPQDARALGASLVETANQAVPARSLVAVDLQALHSELLPGLDRLGQELRHFDKKAVHKALKESEKVDDGLLHDTVDLGSFLSHLQATPGLREACPALIAVEEAFDKTILAMAGHGTISFDTHPGKALPDGWRDFLKHA